MSGSALKFAPSAPSALGAAVFGAGLSGVELQAAVARTEKPADNWKSRRRVRRADSGELGATRSPRSCVADPPLVTRVVRASQPGTGGLPRSTRKIGCRAPLPADGAEALGWALDSVSVDLTVPDAVPDGDSSAVFPRRALVADAGDFFS